MKGGSRPFFTYKVHGQLPTQWIQIYYQTHIYLDTVPIGFAIHLPTQWFSAKKRPGRLQKVAHFISHDFLTSALYFFMSYLFEKSFKKIGNERRVLAVALWLCKQRKISLKISNLFCATTYETHCINDVWICTHVIQYHTKVHVEPSRNLITLQQDSNLIVRIRL